MLAIIVSRSADKWSERKNPDKQFAVLDLAARVEKALLSAASTEISLFLGKST